MARLAAGARVGAPRRATSSRSSSPRAATLALVAIVLLSSALAFLPKMAVAAETEGDNGSSRALGRRAGRNTPAEPSNAANDNAANNGQQPEEEAAAPATTTGYIVVYKPDAAPADVDEARARGSAGQQRGRGHRAAAAIIADERTAFRADAFDDIDEAKAAELAALPGVAYVERDGLGTVSLTQTSPPSWGLDRIDQRNVKVNRAYNYYDNGAANSFIYVLDTGVQRSHPEFETRAQFGIDYTGEGDNDQNGHGTHVAGTAAGRTVGVAKKATIVSVKVANATGYCFWSNLISGINWSVNHCSANVGSKRCVAVISLNGNGVTQAVGDAITAATNAGLLVVVSAGNTGANACLNTPAFATAALVVGSTGTTDTMSTWSARGTCVDLFAPGESIYSAWNLGRYATQSGTSMSAPHVAGAAALLWANGVDTTPAAVAARVLSVATSGVLKSVPTGTANRLVYNMLV